MKRITAAFILTVITAVLCLSPTAHAKTERISVIVELDLPKTADSAEYAKKCANTVSKSIPGFTVEYIYDTLVCGFSGNISADAIPLLKRFDFVDEVYESAEYKPLEYEMTEFSEVDSAMISDAMVGFFGNNTELSGNGVKVAVIDNGFDITHDAFDIEVSDTLDLESLRDSKGAKRPHAFMSVSDPMQLHRSSKIPFAYDYANRDLDVSTTTTFHGNHVAGIIGAAPTEESEMHGIAPECQLILMKIFDEKRNAASDSAFIAALEDAIKLDVDIINLSLGVYAGSASENNIDISHVINKAESMGCLIVAAAGNESVTTRGSKIAGLHGVIYPPVTYTDYGTISFPSTTKYAISVGSVDNKIHFGQHFRHGENEDLFVDYTDVVVTVGEKEISFTEHFHGKTMGYAVIPGVGSESDYKGINVRGKIALVARGEITFVEKVNNAEKMGAVGVIIYNNEASGVNMDLTGAKLPTIMITHEDGKRLADEKIRTLRFSKEFTVREQTGGKVSDFSSYGVTPSLTLKPDICGVGGSVLSLAADNSYAGLSGTSMAAPQITGLLALMIEKACDENISDMAATAEDLRIALMNTANPVVQANGVEYSPRVQGAGLANLAGALSQKITLTSTQNGQAKIELYDKLTGSFNVDVTLENKTDNPQKVKLGATFTNDGYTKMTFGERSGFYNTLTAEADKYSIISCDNRGNLNRYANDYRPLEIMLKPGEVKNVSLTILLDEKYHKELATIFTNGYFAEGFVYCESDEGEISLPYMGYIGDWGVGSITDGDLYSDDNVIFTGTGFHVPLETGDYVIAGLNVFADDGKYDADSIAFSPNGDGNADSISFLAPLLRNCSRSSFAVADANGKKIYSNSEGYLAKTVGSDSLRIFRYDWMGTDGIYDGYVFPDGEYNISIEYYLDYVNARPQNDTYKIIIDTKKPKVKSLSVKGDKIKIEAEDENEIYCISIYENDSAGAYLKSVTDSQAEFDISDYDGDYIYYEIIDCAYNIHVGKIMLNTEKNVK